MFSPLQISAGLMSTDQGPHVQLTADHVALDPAGISNLGYSSQVLALVSDTLSSLVQ